MYYVIKYIVLLNLILNLNSNYLNYILKDTNLHKNSQFRESTLNNE